MKQYELTGTILRCAFTVSNELGCGFLEKVYENALVYLLEKQGLVAVAQKPIDVRFQNILVGAYFADIVVENRVILEIKASEGFRNEHVSQILNYLRATKMPIGLLINFGQPKLQYRRFDNRWLENN